MLIVTSCGTAPVPPILLRIDSYCRFLAGIAYLRVYCTKFGLRIEPASANFLRRARTFAHLRRTCQAGDTQYFWVVDPFEQVVEVYGREGTWHEYRQGATVRLQFDGRDLQIPVARIFEGTLPLRQHDQ